MSFTIMKPLPSNEIKTVINIKSLTLPTPAAEDDDDGVYIMLLMMMMKVFTSCC